MESPFYPLCHIWWPNQQQDLHIIICTYNWSVTDGGDKPSTLQEEQKQQHEHTNIVHEENKGKENCQKYYAVPGYNNIPDPPYFFFMSDSKMDEITIFLSI